MANPHIREVAESLLSSVTNTNYRTLTNSHSVNLVTEDLLAGHRYEGHMSTVRRFFCLFVTFDVLFTALMWLICVMMRGETMQQIFDREIFHYDVKISLFDIVMLAISRFTVLLLFYGLLYINNWSVIALSTSVTCALLIAKVFVFDWPNASQPVYQVFLILSSFTLAWLEAWFLDFRVIPQETRAKQILDSIVGRAPAHERAPLLPARVGGGSTLGESTVNWFSPVDTPQSSPRVRRPNEPIVLTQDQIDEYKHQANESMRNAWRVVNLPDWKVQKRGAKGDIVETVTTEQFGKVYRFTGLVECPAKYLFEEFKNNITKLPEWNPTILKSELIKDISDGIDLSYQVTAGGGGGIIAPRDFVILRRAAALSKDGLVLAENELPYAYISPDISDGIDLSYQVTAGGGGGIIAPRDFVILRRAAALSKDGLVLAENELPYAYISSGVSVTVPGYPPSPDHVRGHNKIGCWLLKPKAVTTPGGKVEHHTVFQWLMCCDLKGKIPQFILDTAFATVMLDYIVHVRKFVADSKAKGLF